MVRIARCLTDEQRTAQKKVTASQLVSWKILSLFNGKYLPTNAWRLLTDPEELFPDAIIQMAVFKGSTRAIFLKAGNSRVRNVAIGAAFQYMHIIEKWGTGIPRILKEAAEYGLREPELKDFGTSFRINIFRKPFETDLFGVVNPAAEKIEGQKVKE